MNAASKHIDKATNVSHLLATIALNFWSPKLNFESHWQPAGSNFRLLGVGWKCALNKAMLVSDKHTKKKSTWEPSDSYEIIFCKDLGKLICTYICLIKASMIIRKVKILAHLVAQNALSSLLRKKISLKIVPGESP